MKRDRPSDTATLIARSILLAEVDPGLAPLLAKGEVAAVRGFLGRRSGHGWFAFAARRRVLRECLMAMERLLLPGIFAHYLARKRWIEREVRGATGGATRRMVILGAGYDSLGWRLCHERPDLSCFEIDHQATQELKRCAPGAPAGLHFLPADLSEELPQETLARCPHDRADEPSMVVVEGLTMYLKPCRVRQLLTSCAQIAGRDGHVLFTFMEQSDDGSIGFRGESSWIRRWLRWRKEPFRWGCSRTALPGFLKGCGLEPVALADHDHLRSEILTPRGLADRPLARGECLCLCQPISP